MALPKSYKPKVTKKLLELKAQLYDVIESVHADKESVWIVFKKGWVAMDGEKVIIAPTAAELMRQFKFKKAGT